MRRTKIISTIGPSTDSRQTISKLIRSGMNIARIKMAHTHDYEALNQKIDLIRAESKKQKKFVGILVDIAGPKIRTKITTDSLKVTKGKKYRIGYGSEYDIPLSLKVTIDKSFIDYKVKIDDGNFEFSISKITDDYIEVISNDSGYVFNRKGVNFPEIHTGLSVLTSKDRRDLEATASMDIDFIALSFVKKGSDIKPVHKILEKAKQKYPIIAKIERPEAIDNLDDIIQSFDGVLIARGDLGVEMPIENLPLMQRNIVNKCRVSSKPVIIATQMLESMIENPHPTRAEITDIASAIIEGCDAIMLSAETATGKFPIEAVETMDRVSSNIEQQIFDDKFGTLDKTFSDTYDIKAVISSAAKTIAHDLDIKPIVVMTESGSTALSISNQRPDTEIVALSPFKKVCQKMTLYWGVEPCISKQFTDQSEMFHEISKFIKKKKSLKKGDSYVIISGLLGVSGKTNMVKIHSV